MGKRLFVGNLDHAVSEESQAVISEYDGVDLNCRKMHVDEARERPSGGGAGDRSGNW